MADDLDDEWWLEGNDKAAEASTVSSDEAEEDVTQTTSPAEDLDEGTTTKRKAEEGSLEESETPKKKKKKKKKSVADKIKETEKPPTPSDLIDAMKKHFEGKLSSIEWDGLKISEDDFCTSSDSCLAASTYLKLVCPKWKKMMKTMEDESGAPLLLIICPAAIRAVQLNRDINEFRESCRTAKLFAKHMKVAEQVKFLNKNSIHIGIGTPNRIKALIENGALKLSQVRRVVIDWSWRDQKLRRLIDIPEIKDELFNLILKHIIPLTQSSNIKIGLY